MDLIVNFVWVDLILHISQDKTKRLLQMTTEAKALSPSLERNASVKCCVCFFPHRPQPINLSYVLANK